MHGTINVIVVNSIDICWNTYEGALSEWSFGLSEGVRGGVLLVALSFFGINYHN